MRYFKKEENGRIVCLLCRHYCRLKEGQTGLCGVNRNDGGALKNLVYGHPSALNVDPVEKKPLYHFLPGSATLSFGTVGCNFQCPFCQNWQISQTARVDEGVRVLPRQMVSLALAHRCGALAYTYNEPTVFYPYARDVGHLAKEKGLKNIFVTNGFESAEVLEDMAGWVDGANVDLKSWDEGYYKRRLKGGLEAVKESLRRMVAAGIWVEVTTLLIEGVNDDEKSLEEMADFIAGELGRHVPWHLSAFHPDYKMTDRPATALATLQKAEEIAKKAGLYYVYLGNVPVSAHTDCPGCGKRVIERRGFRVETNRLADGCCPHCGRKIEGVWS